MILRKKQLNEIADKLGMMSNNNGLNPSYETALKTAEHIILMLSRELESDTFQVTSFKLTGNTIF
jgi:hypothetical protein